MRVSFLGFILGVIMFFTAFMIGKAIAAPVYTVNPDGSVTVTNTRTITAAQMAAITKQASDQLDSLQQVIATGQESAATATAALNESTSPAVISPSISNISN